MESIEIQLARLQEQLKTVIRSIDDNKKLYKDTGDKIDKIENQLFDLGVRVSRLEDQLMKHSPTIEMIVSMQQQAKGIAKISKVLYVTGGIVIGTVLSFRSEILAWITK